MSWSVPTTYLGRPSNPDTSETRAYYGRAYRYAESRNGTPSRGKHSTTVQISCPPHYDCLCNVCAEFLDVDWMPRGSDVWKGLRPHNPTCSGCEYCIRKKLISRHSDLYLFHIFHPDVNPVGQSSLLTSSPSTSTTKPTIDETSSNPLDSLIRLRDSCLTIFAKLPIPNIPELAIEPESHFSEPSFAAHYHPDRILICFKDSYLQQADYLSLVNTMKHELLHAWVHQHNFHGDRYLLNIGVLGNWRKLSTA